MLIQQHTTHTFMDTNWEKFISIHNGAFLARDSFESLCFDILDMHYPGRDIISSDEVEKISSQNLNVVFLSKFFFDELTNSRKGQIRKAFKKFINYKNKKNLKIYAWIFCVPYTLNEEEMKWWLTWKNKSSQEYSINIQFFDGDYCLQLAKKYDLYNKWFTKSKAEKTSIKKEEEEEEDKENIFELIAEEKADINEQKQEKSTKTEDKEKIPFAEKIKLKPKYEILKKEYIRILENAKNLNKKNIEHIKKINSQEKPFDLFNHTEIDNLEILKLFYKAKSSEVRKNYIDALEQYETIITKKDYQSKLKYKKAEIPKAIKFCQEKTEAILNELEGDIFSQKKAPIKALICYEKAFKLDKKNNIIERKYYELYADQLTKQEAYTEALEYYQKAQKIKNNEKTLSKQRNAYWLGKGENFFNFPLFNIFFAPFGFWYANSIIPAEKTKAKLKTSVKKAAIAFSLLIIILFSIYTIAKINSINSRIKALIKTGEKTDIPPLKALKPADIAIAKGDSYMKRLSVANIYLADSAINSYLRAISFDNKNKEAYKKLLKVEKYKKNYIKTAQVRILTQKDKYFISMRRFSDGLQLFKYVYDQKNKKYGKYGYVDSLRNIIIPPVYDFDYNKMYKGTENFINGKALVCLRLSNKDTLFLKINKQNKIIKIYH